MAGELYLYIHICDIWHFWFIYEFEHLSNKSTGTVLVTNPELQLTVLPYLHWLQPVSRPILGFLLIGMVLGPAGLDVIRHVASWMQEFLPGAPNVGFWCRKRRGEALKKVTKVIEGGDMDEFCEQLSLRRRIQGHMKVWRTNGFLTMRGWICSDLYLRMWVIASPSLGSSSSSLSWGNPRGKEKRKVIVRDRKTLRKYQGDKSYSGEIPGGTVSCRPSFWWFCHFGPKDRLGTVSAEGDFHEEWCDLA